MPVDATSLLSSPRGRNFCLAFAFSDWLDDEQLLSHAQQLFAEAADWIDSQRGRGAVRYVAAGHTAAESPRPLEASVSVAQLASALDDVPLPYVSEQNTFSALDSTVDDAVYWDEPDGYQVLLADPVLKPALRRIATHILASPLVSWWSSPLAAEQWCVTFTDTTFPRVELPLAADAHRQWREEAYDFGWWSKPAAPLTATTRSRDNGEPLGLSLIEDSFGWKEAISERVEPRANQRILEIIDSASWAQLCRRYPLEVSSVGRGWHEATGRDGRWVIPDWSLVALEFDVVHLTVSAYLSSAGIAIPVDHEFASVIAGWNPDESYWLTDVETDPASRVGWTYTYTLVDDVDFWKWESRTP